MGHWGWRRILSVFALVWIVGCDIRQDNTPSTAPTQYPPVTLIVRTPRTSTPASPTEAATPSTRTTEAAPALDVIAPRCYAGEAFVCLGLVHNPLDDTIARVAVHVELFDVRGVALAEQDVTIEQRHIPPGGSAPYRVLFSDMPDAVGHVLVSLRSADVATRGAAALRVENERGIMHGGQYIVTADVTNPGPEAVSDLRAIITLRDGDDHLVGYRAVPLAESLPANASHALRVPVMPLDGGGTYTHTLVVEAWTRGARIRDR